MANNENGCQRDIEMVRKTAHRLAESLKSNTVVISVMLPKGSLSPEIRTNIPEGMVPAALSPLLFDAAASAALLSLQDTMPGFERRCIDNMIDYARQALEDTLAAYLADKAKEADGHGED